MGFLRLTLISSFGVIPLLSMSGTALAQSAPICLVREASDISRKAGPVAIEVADSEQSKFAARGFKRKDCAELAERARKFRRQMCQVAILKNPQIEADFYAHYGIRPAEGCPNPEGIVMPK